jgi:hypothetical protein
MDVALVSKVDLSTKNPEYPVNPVKKIIFKSAKVGVMQKSRSMSCIICVNLCSFSEDFARIFIHNEEYHLKINPTPIWILNENQG